MSSVLEVTSSPQKKCRLSRREALTLLGAAAIVSTTHDFSWLRESRNFVGGYLPCHEPIADAELLDGIQEAGFRFFWEQASPLTGLIKDRSPVRGNDGKPLSSIASTGFGLGALCIGDSRGYETTSRIKKRVITALKFLLTKAPNNNGFLYHYMDMNTGKPPETARYLRIDTAILLCGALICRAYFQDPQITNLANRLYERVNWPWMLNGGLILVHSWTPEKGFCTNRWDTYSELMMLYLLAMGSDTSPIPAKCWLAWTRPRLDYQGLSYIRGEAPLFIHQFSHGWIDFRNRHDDFADYFANSTTATRAHKIFCLSLNSRFSDYGENLWGISSSDSPNGYVAWGGPPAMGPIDGTVVPSAAAGYRCPSFRLTHWLFCETCTRIFQTPGRAMVS